MTDIKSRSLSNECPVKLAEWKRHIVKTQQRLELRRLEILAQKVG